MILTEAQKRLAKLLAEYLGTGHGAMQITEAVVAVVDEAIEQHGENSPHIYSDGSTS